MTDHNTSIRIDKWLWAARFFKTRGLATEMVNGGHVLLNGERAKPSKAVQIGDQLQIRRHQDHFTVTVIALAGKRGSATFAQSLYEEGAASITARENAAEQRRLQAANQPQNSRRPDKKSRRQIIRFIRQTD